jgi:hypothetical protein
VGAKDSSPWFCVVCGAKALYGKEAFCRFDFLLLCIKTYGEALLSTLKKTNNYEKLTATRGN